MLIYGTRIWDLITLQAESAIERNQLTLLERKAQGEVVLGFNYTFAD
jgi:hypothetical protein